MKKEWQCERCGKCCKFIVIPIMDPVDMETEAYLNAHGIIYDGKKLIIPAVCQYLNIRWRKQNGRGFVYECLIHNDKFANCRLSGKKECEETQKAWSLLNPKN
jgi:hypothetical protein